jgi:hypothetical protein
MSPQLYLMIANFRGFIKRHHAIVYISLLSFVVAFSIVALFQALTAAFEKPINTESSIQGFDQKTVDRIKNLHNSADSSTSTLVLPSPRANPFSE